MKGVDLFLHVLFDFQESVTSPAAQRGADGDKVGDQRRLDPERTATAQNCENEAEWNVSLWKPLGMLFYCFLCNAVRMRVDVLRSEGERKTVMIHCSKIDIQIMPNI